MGKLNLIRLQELLQFSMDDGVQPVSNCLTLTADGKKIASSLNNVISLHDVKNNVTIHHCVNHVSHTQGVCTVTFSPDGEKIVSGSEDHTLRLWDAWTGQTIESPFMGHSDMVTSVAFSPDRETAYDLLH
jgi:WD40 repeat protein